MYPYIVKGEVSTKFNIFYSAQKKYKSDEIEITRDGVWFKYDNKKVYVPLSGINYVIVEEE